MTLGNGGSLIYYPHISEMNENIVRMAYIWSLLSLAVFAVGTFAYKMIGV